MLPNLHSLGVEILRVLSVLPNMSRVCSAGTASTGSISTVRTAGTARTRITKRFTICAQHNSEYEAYFDHQCIGWIVPSPLFCRTHVHSQTVPRAGVEALLFRGGATGVEYWQYFDSVYCECSQYSGLELVFPPQNAMANRERSDVQKKRVYFNFPYWIEFNLIRFGGKIRGWILAENHVLSLFLVVL